MLLLCRHHFYLNNLSNPLSYIFCARQRLQTVYKLLYFYVFLLRLYNICQVYLTFAFVRFCLLVATPFTRRLRSWIDIPFESNTLLSYYPSFHELSFLNLNYSSNSYIMLSCCGRSKSKPQSCESKPNEINNQIPNAFQTPKSKS